MRISDLSPITTFPGDANFADAPDSCGDSSAADFLALINRMTAPDVVTDASPSPKAQPPAPQSLAVLNAELEPLQAPTENATQAATDSSTAQQGAVRESGARPDALAKEPSDDAQSLQQSALFVSQPLVPNTPCLPSLDPTFARPAANEGTTDYSVESQPQGVNPPGGQAARGTDLGKQSWLGMNTSVQGSFAAQVPLIGGTVPERQPRQAASVTNDESARDTDASTGAASPLNEFGGEPRQQQLPLGEAAMGPQQKQSAATPAMPLIGPTDDRTSPAGVSADANPAFGNGSTTPALMSQEPDSLPEDSPISSRTDVLTRAVGNSTSSAAEDQARYVRASENLSAAINASDSGESQSTSREGAVAILISARTRNANDSETAADADEGNAGGSGSAVTREGAKPGDLRGLPVKEQSSQQASFGETSMQTDLAELLDPRAEMAQPLLNKVPGKAVAEPDRPAKSGGIEFRDGIREGLPGMSAVADPKSASIAREAQVSAPRTSEFVYQLAERIQTQLQTGQGEVRIHLKPENLGNLEIKAESGASGIVARIETESSSVKQYLESNLHSLQQSLQDQGLKVDRIDVVLQESLDLRHSSNHQPGQAGGGRQGSEAGSSEDRSRLGSSIPESEIVVDPWIASALGSNSTFHAVA